MSALTTLIKDLAGLQPDYVAHNINNTKIFYGQPPLPIFSWEYIVARYNNPQSKLIMSLNTKGIFLNNRNLSGIVEIGILSSTVSCAAIELLDTTGIPFPLVAADISAIGSIMAAAAAKKMEVPEWRRELVPHVSIYRFEASSLVIASGLRKADTG